jgi:hypothetical protein
VLRIEGNFCNKVFTSTGKEDWFSLELKLDNFTSGFRTTYADTAGGHGEVVAVGGGIGTGVELNKKGEADEAADRNGWVGGAAEGKWGEGEAAAEQVNSIWSIS